MIEFYQTRAIALDLKRKYWVKLLMLENFTDHQIHIL